MEGQPAKYRSCVPNTVAIVVLSISLGYSTASIATCWVMNDYTAPSVGATPATTAQCLRRWFSTDHHRADRVESTWLRLRGMAADGPAQLLKPASQCCVTETLRPISCVAQQLSATLSYRGDCWDPVSSAEIREPSILS